jgi:hypothetical protein
MTSVEEKLVQYRLGWFGHIQRRATETSIRNGVIRRINNEKRDRERSNLIWEKYVKRDLNDCCITKELALDRRELKLTIYVPESWSSVPSLLLLFLSSFFPSLFTFLTLCFIVFLLFRFGFLSSFLFIPLLFHSCFILFFCSCCFISNIPQLVWE